MGEWGDSPRNCLNSQEILTKTLINKQTLVVHENFEQTIHQKQIKQDLVFSVELHLGLNPHPLTLTPYPVFLIPNPLSLIPYMSTLML